MRNAERLRCLNIPAPACRAAPSAADRNDLAGAPATPFRVLRAAARFAVFVSLVVGGAVGFGDDAQAQTFNSVVVFGDSASDAGNWATVLGLPAGSGFTTNPDPVWSESVAQTFGVSGAPSESGGTNYAWGGACVVNPCEDHDLDGEPRPVPSLTEQIDEYLDSVSGRADPNALYITWGGVNDGSYLVGEDSLTAENVEARANALVRQIRRLQDAGARFVVVLNTPASLFGPDSDASQDRDYYDLFDRTLASGLRSRQDGVVPINASALIEEIRENPGTYGITNTNLDDSACGRDGATPDCGPRGSTYTNQYDPGTNRSHLYADDPHPTGGGLHIGSGLSLGRASADIERSIVLGPATRTERGTTDASQFGADIDVGLVMGESEKYDHGPFVGFAWLNQTVDGYRESGSSSTSMNFSDFDFDSSIVRAGYRVAARSDSGRGGIRPYASIAYERELDDEPVSVTAGSNSMPGRFTLEGYSRQSNSISTSLGISMSLGGQTRAFAGYFGRLGGNSLRRHQLGVGLSF